MFKKDLKRRLQEIFEVAKTTFDAPSDAFEQDTLFITITKSTANTGNGKATAIAEGYLTVFSQNDRFPYGFFDKRIHVAQKENPELTKPLFFFDIDVDIANSPARLINIAERRASFRFLYKEAYDPAKGMESVEFCNEGEE